MIRAFASCRATKRLTINSRWKIPIREDPTVLAGEAPVLQSISPPQERPSRCRAGASLADLLNSGRDMAEPSPEDRSDSLSVPWVDTVRFIRQLSHDLRNHLNAIELQSAYISELEDAKLKSEINRLREMISGMTAILQKVSGGLGKVKPNLISYRASDFVEDLGKKIAQEFPNERSDINWDVQPGSVVLNIDPQLLQEAIVELFANAFRHDRGEGAIVVAAKIDKDQFLFTLREPKIRFQLSTENWGREPFQNVSHGHYGLGLNRIRTIVEAHGGEMHAQYDPKASALVTALTLPLSREKA
jgi:K+-sensing histidine kinase KdpD